MATKKKGAGGDRSTATKLRLRGLDPGEEAPDVEVSALDREGETIASVSVGDDGTFELPAAVLEKAHRIRIGPSKEVAEDIPSSAFLTYRAVDFKEVLERGTLDLGRSVWEGWFFHYRCVSGTVSRCRRSPWWHLELARAAKATSLYGRRVAESSVTAARELASPVRIPGTFDLDDLVLWPTRCSRICLGTVEVYRRVCCCKPWVFLDPRLDGLLEELERLVRGLPEIPDIPLPGPGPDPAPLSASLIRDGALDERALRASRDLEALRSLPAVQIAEYVNARPYLICRGYACGSPKKVAQGPIGPDGRFNVCWSEFPRLLIAGCHEEYAYKVRQKIGPFTITIYDGVAAGRWYRQDDEAALKSYHPWAIACRDNGGPGDAFVYLDEIGDTDSSLLGTPDADGATSVQIPGYNGGVAFPAGGPAGNGSHDRNWGGTLKLAIMFSESMRDVGAKYYRVSVVEADTNGDPVGDRQYVHEGLSWNKAVAVTGGVDVVPVGLGPTSAGPAGQVQDNLYEIPFDGDLGSNADWEADQYHVFLDTRAATWKWNDASQTSLPVPPDEATKRHLVTIEIFNGAGERLRPNGTPVSGLGGNEIEADFTFRRKISETGPTNMVPYGALTHLFWWDNRDVVAEIVDLRMNGIESDDECQFLHGTPSSTFGIGYRAYHPWVLFQRSHAISWKRGLSGGSDTMLTSTSNVGVPPAGPGPSPTHTFDHMLNHPTPATPPRTRCAFTVFLHTLNKATDGDDLGYGHANDSAAFALDIGPPGLGHP